MEGLRSLAAKSKKTKPKKAKPNEDIRLWSFRDSPNSTACVYQVWPRVDRLGAVDDFHVDSVEKTVLTEFLQRGILAVSPCEPAPAFCSAGVKVVFLDTNRDYWWYRDLIPKNLNYILMPQAIFGDLVDKLSSDPLSISMFGGFYPLFEHLGELADGGIAVVHLRTPKTRFMWSIRQHENSPSFDTRCIAIVGHGHYDERTNANFEERCTLLECLEAFKQDVHSPLYFPFVVSVHAFHFCRILLDMKVEAVLTNTEYTKASRRNITTANDQTESIGRTLLTITTTLDSIELLYQYLEDMANGLPPSARSEKVLQSTHSILCAIRFQRKSIQSLREGLNFAERRVRNRASWNAVALSSRDSKINIKTAVASRDLAAAARRDSSAMKSIAVLTMAFLPGTFFATLFSMPSLGWDQPGYFALYWVYTIPFTVATFIVWAIFSQRHELAGWARERAREKCPLLPMWCLMPRKRKPDDMDMDMMDAVGYGEDKELKALRYRRREAKKRLRARIDRWKRWKRDDNDDDDDE